MTGSVTVAGGAGSISVDYESMSAAALALHRHRAELTHALAGLSSSSADSILGGTAPLDPIGAAGIALHAARTFAALCEAEACSVALESGIRLAAAGYQRADDLDARLAPLLRGMLELPSALARAAPLLAPNLQHLRLPDVPAAASALLFADPALAAGVVDVVSNAASPAGMVRDLAGSPARPASPATIALLAGSAYRDGSPTIPPLAGPNLDAEGPPHGVRDVLRGLACRDDATDGGGIDVRSVWRLGPDGTEARSVIVDITGTRDWNVARLDNPNVADFGTNLRAMAGLSTSYEKGILLALKAAGVRPDEPIMLVGHSQGGLVAAQLTAHLGAAGRLGTGQPDSYRVTHLLTAGAPIGLVRLPPAVEVMSLENAGDPIPELDTADNRRSAHQLTVRVDRGGSTPQDRHSIRHGYLPAAADIDAAAEPRIGAWLTSASSFFEGHRVATETFNVQRR